MTFPAGFALVTYQIVEPDRYRLGRRYDRIHSAELIWNSGSFRGLNRHEDLNCIHRIRSRHMCMQTTAPQLRGDYGYLASTAPTFTDHETSESMAWDRDYPAELGESQTLSHLHVPCFRPSLEQAAIVRYLDYVVRRIRRYVAAKEKLIGLLEEEKQAVIHRAVTRGLDPNVPLKPSGVEWLGDVPAHWEVRRTKSFFRLRTPRQVHESTE